jgi:Tfp pilus assembly protein PilX
VLKRLRDESGIALVLALMVMFTLTIVTTTVIFYTTSNQHSSQLSLTRDGSYRLGEAGINNAMSILGSPPDPTTLIGNNALDPNVFCGLPTGGTNPTRSYTSTNPPCAIKDVYSNGYVIWSATLASVNGTPTWKITSTGYVVNTDVNGGGTYSTRTLTVNVTVHPTLTQPLNTPVWNYIYATKPASSPASVCDETLTQSVVINSPFYVEGNLCLANTSSIISGPLVVKGRLTMGNPSQNFAGTSAAPLSDAHIVNGCTATATHVPCNWNGTSTVQGLDKLYATVLDSTPPSNLTPPVPAYNNWYLNSSPGPYFPCLTINNLAPLSPLTFDTNQSTDPLATDATKLLSQDNNVATQDLTPGYNYRCQTNSGELSWDNTAKLLTIKGTIYIDGSVYVQNGAVNRYTGQGVIYLGGTLFMKGASLCGAIDNSTGKCDLRPYQSSPLQGWDPNLALLCFVAKGVGTGGLIIPGSSAEFTSASLQGAVFATGTIDLVTTSNVDGPMVGYQVNLGQSTSTSFPSITIVPQGMPSNPTAYAQIDPPSSYSG